MRGIRQIVLIALVAALAQAPAHAQQAGGNGQPLPVRRCDPAANTCSGDATGFSNPVLGAAGRATVLSPSRRTTEIGADSLGQQVPVPGCGQTGPGNLVCESLNEFQHCRALMSSGMVKTCRIDSPFSGGYIEGRPAAPGSYQVEVESSARVRVTRGDRTTFGQPRGEAKVVLTLAPPPEAAPPAWCLQRDTFVYYSTGPNGGLSDIDDTDECDKPLEFSFRPHQDDLLRAYDLCEAFAAWDSEIEDSIEVLAAGLFHIRSASPEFARRYPSGGAVIAPYVTVKAPLTIDCRT